jgi:hypothetical protein
MDRMGCQTYLPKTIFHIFENPLHNDRKPEISLNRLLQSLYEILLPGEADAGGHSIANPISRTLLKSVLHSFGQLPGGNGYHVSYVSFSGIGCIVSKRYLKETPSFTPAVFTIDADSRETIDRKVTG